MEPDQAKNFAGLWDETDRAKKIKRYGIVLSTTALVIVLVGFLFGMLPGLGFASVYAYVVNQIIAKPRERRTHSWPK